ncbi:MAG: BACON domain-containing protein [Bacteroidales bacterium]|nr:BACON domain-containing protein [Bacteroidales bacterium]
MMKHPILDRAARILLMTGLLLAACTNPVPEKEADPLLIRSSQLEFSASGGSGHVTLETDEALAAESDREWCKTRVSGSTIQLEVAPCGDLESRNANLRISTDKQTLRVTVRQAGAFIHMPDCDTTFLIGDESVTLSLPGTSDIGMSVSGNVDWISGTFDGELLSFSASENTSGHIREGYAIFQAGKTRDSVRIIQGGIRDVCKRYILSGQDNSGKATQAQVVLSEASDRDLLLTFPDQGWTFTATFDPADLSIHIPNMQYGGTTPVGAGRYHVFLHQYLSEQQLFNSSAGGSISAKFSYDAARDRTIAAFYDDGSWPGSVPDGIIVVAYSRRDASGAPAGLKRYPLILGKLRAETE